MGVSRLYSVGLKLLVRCHWLELLSVHLSPSVAYSFAILNDMNLVLLEQLTHISVEFRLTFAPYVSSRLESWLNDLILCEVMIEFCSSV